MKNPAVRVESWTKATAAEQRTGLCGYVRVAYGSLELDCITIRRTASGQLRLSFPGRIDYSGRRHSIVRPAHDAARDAIEREVFRQLAEQLATVA